MDSKTTYIIQRLVDDYQKYAASTKRNGTYCCPIALLYEKLAAELNLEMALILKAWKV